MLRDKFRSVNPDVSFGVNCWRNDIDLTALKAFLGTDFIAYEGGEYDDPEGRSNFRGSCNYLEIPFGTWSWNGCEMEIDQLAQMNVNTKMLQKPKGYEEIEYCNEKECKRIYRFFYK